jgi:hypothetical protein
MYKIYYRTPLVHCIGKFGSEADKEEFMVNMLTTRWKDYVRIDSNIILPGPLRNGRSNSVFKTETTSVLDYPLITIQNENGEILEAYGLAEKIKKVVDAVRT